MNRRAFAPGRVNLIGEHTDYNGGLALPFAIAQGVTITATPARDLPDDPFVRGVCGELGLNGVRVEIESDLPIGAGLSSSAAYCVALALACGGEPGDRLALARLCSRVENDWVGAPTGLLDQLAVLFAREDHVLRIDFTDLTLAPVPLAIGDHVLAVLDSGARHEHATGGYRQRRAECDAVCARLGLATLREADEQAAAELPPPLDRRARHVITENARVEQAVRALNDPVALAELLDASHASLRDDYEVSVPQVEAAVTACKDAGALGARIMGGGFGGSVLALFPPGVRLPRAALPVVPSAAARLVHTPC